MKSFADAALDEMRKTALPGSAVMDPCFGTRATAKACLPEPMNQTFYG